jgi:hypothetical protein
LPSWTIALSRASATTPTCASRTRTPCPNIARPSRETSDRARKSTTLVRRMRRRKHSRLARHHLPVRTRRARSTRYRKRQRPLWRAKSPN